MGSFICRHIYLCKQINSCCQVVMKNNEMTSPWSNHCRMHVASRKNIMKGMACYCLWRDKPDKPKSYWPATILKTSGKPTKKRKGNSFS